MCRSILVHITFLFLVVCILNSISHAEIAGYWKLDENSGYIAYDSSGNGLDGILFGDTSWVNGIFGSAIRLDGIDDHVELPIMDIHSNTMTITAWIKRNGSQIPFSGIVFLRDLTTNNISLGLNFSDDSEVGYVWNNSGQEFEWDSELTVSNNEWTFVALVVEPDQATIYINDNTAVNIVDHKAQSFTVPFYLGWDIYSDNRRFKGQIDDVRIYDHSLNPEEIQIVMSGRSVSELFASNPNPENEDIYVPKENVNLNWKSGAYARKHNLYLGTVWQDVNDADTLNTLGVFVLQNYDSNNYTLENLDFGQTYYWRVDEVSAAPGETVYKGDVWSFTVEPFIHIISGENIIASASSQDSSNEGPENTINGSGLNPDNLEQHLNLIDTMWITEPNDPNPWILYEFDKVYKLFKMLIWNYNGENVLTHFGLKDVLVEYSVDYINWFRADVSEFNQASGENNYIYNTIIDFGNVAVKYVRISVISNYGAGEPIFNKFGLSEVRFLHIPVHARNPKPGMNTNNVDYDVLLTWQPGREAAQHNVYLSADEQTVINSLFPIITVNQPSYHPPPLNIATKYYWRVDEVNSTGTMPLWKGDIWSFTTQDYLIVDDFEDYNDSECYRIFDIWQDGFNDPTNGSIIGNPEPAFEDGEHFIETDIVYAGKQSTLLIYDNTTSNSSEVTVNTLLLDINRDWTIGSPNLLVFWFYGHPANLTTEQLYMKINNTKVLYPGEMVDITKPVWRPFIIDLSGVDLNNVSMLAIGLEKTEAIGSTGQIYIDELRLYSDASDVPSEEIWIEAEEVDTITSTMFVLKDPNTYTD